MEFSPEAKQEILKKLSFKSRKPPCARTCKSRLQFAAGVLNIISKNITRESAMFANSIISTIQVYLERTEFIALDKLILRISSKVFIPELFEQVRNRDNPEIAAAICYVKYKQLSILDTRILGIFHRLEGNIKMKIESIFWPILQGDVCRENDADKDSTSLARPSSIADSVSQLSSRMEYYNCGPECEVSSRSVFKDMIGNNRIWNDFSGYARSMQVRMLNDEGSYRRLFLSVKLIEEDKIKEAKTKLLLISKTLAGPPKLVAYNLLSYIHFVSLEFQESMFYIDLCLNSSTGFDYEFVLDCKLLIERTAMIQSVSPSLHYRFDHPTDPNRYQEHFENKLLMRSVLSTSFERICLYSNAYLEKSKLEKLLKDAQNRLTGYSILYMFSLDGDLYINDTEAVHTFSADWSEARYTFDQIMAENSSILSMKASSTEDKQYWWSTRIRLDKELEDLLSGLRSKSCIETRSRILFVLDESIVDFPFEVLFGKPSLRVLSRDFFSGVQTNRIESLFYLLDPANNLPSTRETITKYISKEQMGWPCKGIGGVVGRPLNREECKSLESKDLFMYFGHGTGKKYFEICGEGPRALFLFGCSSCRLLTVRNFKCNGFSMKYIRKRMVLGNLWDVTDKDLDKLTIAVLEDFFQGRSLVESVYKNRHVCKLRYLNSAALVIYGACDVVRT